MRFLFIGDVHVKHCNLSAFEKLLSKMRLLKEEEVEIDVVVVAGDILDTHEKVDVQLLNRAYDLIRVARDTAKSGVYVLVGNHDYINNHQFLTTNHWMNGLKEWDRVTVVDERPVFITPLFLACPYVYPGRFREALSSVSLDGVVAVFAHQEFKGCYMGAINSTTGDDWSDADLPIVISGHIHERQSVGEKVFYPGSAINHSFGYDSQGLFVFDFPDDAERPKRVADLRATRIDLNLNVKKIKRFDAVDVIRDPKKIHAAAAADSSTTIYRYVVTGTKSELDALKVSLKNLPPVDVKFVIRREEEEEDSCCNNDQVEGRSAERINIFDRILHEMVTRDGDAQLMDDYKTILLL